MYHLIELLQRSLELTVLFQVLPNTCKDLISIFNQKGWHKSFYAFREDTWTGMNYELGTEKIKWDKEGKPMRQDNSLWDVIKKIYKRVNSLEY